MSCPKIKHHLRKHSGSKVEVIKKIPITNDFPKLQLKKEWKNQRIQMIIDILKSDVGTFWCPVWKSMKVKSEHILF